MVSVAEDLSAVHDYTGVAPLHGDPILFAIARDAQTIFTSWNINWRSVFLEAVPVDRQVYLRVIGGNGTIETRVAVEPMSTTHCLTVSGSHNAYRVEMGYFTPFDSWHSVATSDEVEMPPQRSSKLADVDLATIPFHITFQRLANLLATDNNTSLARFVSECQKRVLSSNEPNETTASDKQVLRNLNLSLHELAAAQRSFENIDTEKLVRRARTLLEFCPSSPVRGFEASAGS